jgi:tRNA-(ms[2]io[6]A)-hydroxylase
LNPTASILLAATPAPWVEYASLHWRELILDHANCEKKAASTALSLMFAYPDDRRLCSALSRLAREELRHFEQVQTMMEELGVPHARTKPGRYGAALRQASATSDPGRKLDLLLVGALIEARSCERFELLAPRLPAPLGDFYASLRASEARHFELYLDLARRTVERDDALLERRLRALAEVEAELATAPDAVFRFHSGEPASVAEAAG